MTVDRSNWMARLSDALPLTSMTIPGTHDSSTFLIDMPWVQTQTVDFTTQLENGVRFLDIRCRVDGERLMLCHGTIDLDTHLDYALQQINDFINGNNSETVIVSIKRDAGNEDPSIFYNILSSSYITDDSWLLQNSVPTLGQARGKKILMRRFSAPVPYGWDCTDWGDDSTFTATTIAGCTLRVQDNYMFKGLSGLSEKWNSILQVLQEAQGNWEFNPSQTPTLYINFTSATGLRSPLVFALGEGAGFTSGMLARIKDWVPAEDNLPYGIIPMDFVGMRSADYTVNDELISTNFGEIARDWQSNKAPCPSAPRIKDLWFDTTCLNVPQGKILRGVRFVKTTYGRYSFDNRIAAVLTVSDPGGGGVQEISGWGPETTATKAEGRDMDLRELLIPEGAHIRSFQLVATEYGNGWHYNNRFAPVLTYKNQNGSTGTIANMGEGGGTVDLNSAIYMNTNPLTGSEVKGIMFSRTTYAAGFGADNQLALFQRFSA